MAGSGARAGVREERERGKGAAAGSGSRGVNVWYLTQHEPVDDRWVGHVAAQREELVGVLKGARDGELLAFVGRLGGAAWDHTVYRTKVSVHSLRIMWMPALYICVCVYDRLNAEQK